MTDPVMNIGPTAYSRAGADISASTAAPFQEASMPGAHQEFQAMLNDPDALPGYGLAQPLGGTVMDMVRAVDFAHQDMQSKLLRVSVSPLPENVQAASVALSKYDLETLFLAKLGSKGFQALDRLTNLQ